MPDETPPLELTPATPNAAQHNAAVAVTVAEQGRDAMKPTTVATESLETRDALEELRTKVTKEKTDAAAKAAEEAETDGAAPAPAPVVEKKETPTKEASDATIAPAKPDPAPVAASDKPDDIFASVHLPPNIKPKSAEAFEKVKALGREQIAERDARLAEMERKLAELEAQAKQPADENLLKELEDHRTFRSKLDVEADPKFKAYDKEISDNQAFVYSQLLKTGKITQEDINTIKKHGGPTKVTLEKVFALIDDPHVQRTIQARIADEEMLHFKKEQAIKETKENVAGYLKEREEAFSKATKSHNDATQKQFSTLVAKMDWVKEKPLPKDANDSVKADVKSHNEFVASTKKDLEAALQDDSPEMRAILLAGMGQLLQLQRVDAAKTQKLAAVEKELSEALAKLERIKGASKSRLPESSAPVNAKVPEAKKDSYATPTGDAIENIRKQILQEKAEKAAAA